MTLRSLVVSSSLLVAVSASRPAPADERRPVFIWYRSAGACPDGEAFLAKLSGKVGEARIAAAGDPIDFVVTLGSLGAHSNGRLERETLEGKVAIREIDSDDCAEVAEALALSLALALDPAGNSTDPEPQSPAPKPPGEEHGTAREPTRAPPNPELDRAPVRRRESHSWWVGGQASVASGIAPSVLPGGLVFVELDREHASALPGSSVRLGAMARFGTVMTEVGDVRYRLIGARLEACPLRLGGDNVAMKPCAGFDLGQLQVQGTDSDSGLTDSAVWAAAGVEARLVWRAVRTLSFELNAGAFAPLTRYTLQTENPNRTGDRSDFAGFSAGLGVSVPLP